MADFLARAGLISDDEQAGALADYRHDLSTERNCTTGSARVLPCRDALCPAGFYCGTDKFTGRNFDYRRQWIENRVRLLAASPVQAKEARCDCSCPAYERLLCALDSDSPETMEQVDRCGSQCAIAWVDCEAAQTLVDRAVRSNGDSQPASNENPSRPIPQTACAAESGGFGC